MVKGEKGSKDFHNVEDLLSSSRLCVPCQEEEEAAAAAVPENNANTCKQACLA